MKINVSFSLDDKEDADIIRWLERQRRGSRSEAIRQAVRTGWKSGAGVEAKVDEILRRLDGGVVMGRNVESEAQPQRRAALDKLGL